MSTSVAPASLTAGARPDGALTRLRGGVPWWLLPVTVVAVLGGFTVYSLWTNRT